jgi:hypothetical protein
MIMKRGASNGTYEDSGKGEGSLGKYSLGQERGRPAHANSDKEEDSGVISLNSSIFLLNWWRSLLRTWQHWVEKIQLTTHNLLDFRDNV